MKVCILWHMHQPDYRLPGEGGRAAMPWVRLHAAKDYMDMARLAEEAPANVRTTFNLTPCLLEQLKDLAEGRHADAFLDIARKDPRDWNEGERLFALTHFFSAHEDRQIRTLPRYAELKEKRDRARARGRLTEAFHDAELRDLTVLFHLAWSGQWLRREPAVQFLLAKGRGYGESDKATLLEAQDAQAKEIFPLYAKLAREGRIEISTTPLYHPILPLLIDLRAASEARHGCSTGGVEFRWPEDARAHVDVGLARTEQHLGWRPRGVWPSEGSLSEAALAVLEQAGVQWCATDEQNLRKSLPHGHAKPGVHLRPWRLRGEGPAIFFRDTQLSDLIGFTYARWEAPRAVDDFVHRMREVARQHEGSGEPIVPVILDGENAWESYAENGELFLRELYERLGKSPGIEATTFSHALETAHVGKLPRLAPGSWIYGNFDTWAGHPEKNRAWELLSAVRREVEDAKPQGRFTDEVREVLFRAEGSDWFWWLGDDHPTAYLSEFESLFRRNLRWICERIGRKVDGLDEPIPRRRRSSAAVDQPLALIGPRIDGTAARFYEWVGSGVYRAADDGGAMRLGTEPLVSEVRFGFDLERLYLRLVPRRGAARELRDARVRVLIEGGRALTLEWRGGSVHVPEEARGLESACDRVLELAIPRALSGLVPGASAHLSFEVDAQDGRRELIPRSGAIELKGPDEHFDLRNWTL